MASITNPPDTVLLPVHDLEARAVLGNVGALHMPELIFGGASFSNFYNSNSLLESATPLQTIRLALRYGICAFDTSPYYGPSEIVLGNALKALETEFPRSSYQLMTKCGRYGRDVSSFDYSPARIRASVYLSLDRLKTTYLDTVYLHDVEFVCTQISPWTGGNPVRALKEEVEYFGLAQGEEGKVREEGEQAILDAVAELRLLQTEGLIKNVGISGYPLPTLLRIALLVLHTPPYKPLDVVLSYSHLTLQNDTLITFAPQFRERAKVRQLVTASPLSMALLTSNPPAWHPASSELLQAVALARKNGEEWAGELPNLALGYAIRNARTIGVPLAIGLSNPHEVQECMKVWEEVSDGDNEKRKATEEKVRNVIGQSGFLSWSWASP